MHSLPDPWIACVCPETSPGFTIGSSRATPDRPRQGRRQNAVADDGKSVKQAINMAVSRMSCILRLKSRVDSDVDKGMNGLKEWNECGSLPETPSQSARHQKKECENQWRVSTMLSNMSV